MIVLYLGPDSLLPLGSILAAVVGFFLLFGNRLKGLVKRSDQGESDNPRPESAGDQTEANAPENQGR